MSIYKYRHNLLRRFTYHHAYEPFILLSGMILQVWMFAGVREVGRGMTGYWTNCDFPKKWCDFPQNWHSWLDKINRFDDIFTGQNGDFPWQFVKRVLKNPSAGAAGGCHGINNYKDSSPATSSRRHHTACPQFKWRVLKNVSMKL